MSLHSYTSSEQERRGTRPTLCASSGLVEFKGRVLAEAPRPAIGDGGLGFRKAAEELFPEMGRQRCWMRKTANVLYRFPNSMAPQVKSGLHNIQYAPGRGDAKAALARFRAKFAGRHPNAAECPEKDEDALLAFMALPAAHRKHLRTTNPIESLFATVRSKGCLSQNTAKLMVFKLARAAEKRWNPLDGRSLSPNVIRGVRFRDGDKVIEPEAELNEEPAA